ncbi:MAG: hypothetical protein AAFY59_15770 [Pseudomonadota bacterium]
MISVSATGKDHVSPWRSVYKIGLLTDTDVTFVLTAGGHNGGVLSEPGHPRRHFRQATKREGARHIGPDRWIEETAPEAGSWWPIWSRWMAEHGSAARADRTPETGPALGAAPGRYVFG